MIKNISTLSFVLLSLSLSMSCRNEEIKQYKVPKSDSLKTVAVAPKADADRGFVFVTPDGWEPQPASAMRLASFKTAEGADISVVNLPAQSGDLKSNVNRWRGQVGLSALDSDAEISKSLRPVQIDGTPAVELELYAPKDKEDKAMRVVLLQKNGQRWFLKLSGAADIVKAQGEKFAQFSRSFQVKSASGETTAAQLPGNGMGDTNSGTGAQPPQASSLPFAEPTASLAYKLPPQWTEKDKGSVRVASFDVKDQGLTGDVSVVTLAGDGGGLLENTNRWRQQLEMAPTNQDGIKNTVKDITVDGNKGYYMALYTNMDGSGMLVSLIERDGLTWFIKMMGPAKLIQSQEQPFQDFLSSIQFKGAAS